MTIKNYTPIVTRKQIENSAIGSWAGYIYQGLCALYHVLSLFEKDRSKCAHYKLSLDAFEDFSIIDDNNVIISLHQCKDYKKMTSFKNEFTKMIEKKNVLLEQKMCSADCVMFFHSNLDSKPTSPIQVYTYYDGTNKCHPGEIFDKIRIIQDAIINKYDVGTSFTYIKIARLTSLIEKAVLDIQQQSNNSGELLRDTARKSFIEFTTIHEIIFSNGIDGTLENEDMTSLLKAKYVMCLQKAIEDCNAIKEVVNEERIEHFISSFMKLSPNALFDFIKRVNPHTNVDNKLNTLIDIAGKQPINNLFNQLNVLEELNLEHLCWKNHGIFQTPSTLGRDCNCKIHCKDIYENMDLDVLREYDWIVGDVDTSIEDINETYDIMKVDRREYNQIFSTKKVGILSINDKQNGKYLRTDK